MTFSFTPETASSGGTGGGSAVSDDQWKEWNDYYYSLLDGKEQPHKNKQGDIVEGRFYKKKKLVGKLAMLVDCGLQPQPDSSYEWKGEITEEEHIAKYPDNYFKTVDGKRMQFKPERPTQEFAFYFDFPKIMVDWTKHPIEALHSLGQKPLRVSYNGYFKNSNMGLEGFAKQLRFAPNFRTGKVSPNNPIYKIATAMNVADEFESSNYDFGKLAGGYCFFDVYITKNTYNGKSYYDAEIKNYSEITEIEAGENTITVEQQIPQSDIPFVGVTLNGGNYSDEVLDMVSHKKELMAVLPRAKAFQPNATKNPDFWLGCNWKDSDLCKALGDRAPKVDKNGEKVPVAGTEVVEQSSVQQESGVVQQKDKVVEEPVEESFTPAEDDFDFQDDVPF